MYTSDPKQAFINAINKGLDEPDNWMYMYSEGNFDYFKNKLYRNYRKFENSIASYLVSYN
jgi:hypothetical protein